MVFGFRGLQNYTTLKHNVFENSTENCFRGLQNYTTLKQGDERWSGGDCFRGLQNYTTLKPQIKFEAQE